VTPPLLPAFHLGQIPRYAAGIVEVWIVNLVDERIEAYSDPAGGVYRTITIHLRGESLAPVALPDLTIGVDEILG
jgi:Uma2 family endonuclease